MKKLLSVLLAVAMFATPILASATTLADIEAAGKLVIGTSPDFPPFEELQADESIVGIEIDMLNIICEKLGVALEIKSVDFESVIPGVVQGKFDAGVSGITITEKRQKNALFTTPYCMAAQAIVVLENSPITCKADLDGKKLSVQTGTTAEIFTMDAGYNVLSFAANSDAQLSLVKGKVDAWVIDDLTAAEMVAAYNADNPEVKLVVLSEPMTTEPYGLAFNQESTDLVEKIDEILIGMIEDGTIASLFEKYGALYFAPTQD